MGGEKPGCQRAQRAHRRGVGHGIEGGDTPEIGGPYRRIVRYDYDRGPGQRALDQQPLLRSSHPVGDDNRLAGRPFPQQLDRTTRHFQRLGGRLGDDESHVELPGLHSRKRAKPRLEIGQDHRIFRFDLPEQLLR